MILHWWWHNMLTGGLGKTLKLQSALRLWKSQCDQGSGSSVVERQIAKAHVPIYLKVAGSTPALNFSFCRWSTYLFFEPPILWEDSYEVIMYKIQHVRPESLLLSSGSAGRSRYPSKSSPDYHGVDELPRQGKAFIDRWRFLMWWNGSIHSSQFLISKWNSCLSLK